MDGGTTAMVAMALPGKGTDEGAAGFAAPGDGDAGPAPVTGRGGAGWRWERCPAGKFAAGTVDTAGCVGPGRLFASRFQSLRPAV